MKILAIDLETYSSIDIRKAGLYKYVENSEILLFAYTYDDEPVRVVDMACGETVPENVLADLDNPDVLKTAFNAAFEMHVLGHWLGRRLDPAQWFCTMVQSYTLGLPGSLKDVGKVLNLAEDKQKLATGSRLIQYFCKPCRPTKANGGRTRNRPADAPEKWELFKTYNGQDVEAERAIRKKIDRFYPNTTERKLWCLDQKINDAGVRIDETLVRQAITLDARIKEDVLQKAVRLTGMSNPNSNAQLLDWFEQQEGWRPETLDKKARAELLQDDSLSAKTRTMLQYKQLLSKTSVKKYLAMETAECSDGRVHGMLQFYGAARTGRWAGRLVQLHNLPQNHLDDLDDAREMVKAGDLDSLDIFYDNPSDVLSQLIRTAFIAGNGKRFIVADFSAIEARVIAWYADEAWRLQAFADGKDIYCASASRMFGVPVVKHGINGELRQKGKVAELACGYGGGVNALKAFGADKMGLTEEHMQDIIRKWRQSSPHIVKMWSEVENAAKTAIRHKGARVRYRHGLEFYTQAGLLFIQLPSGRAIAYVKPRIEQEDEFKRETLTYEGVILNGGWGRNYTWGGKLVENIVQATARDCLAMAMLRLDEAGYKIVMHVHDEVILEMPYGTGSLNEATDIMGQPIPWAPGLLLRADGYETPYYKKD
ncbi:DNA polymerase [uncultured Megasphaera sp.]|uniref:DNA polymerase n=1 Tax=uncultured Megasphaera sp. TaxID=165188 RepID=UPI003783ED1E